MDEYLIQTKGILAIIQSNMQESEKDKSLKVGEELYNVLYKMQEKYQLNMLEMINIVLGLNAIILELALDEMNNNPKFVN